MKEEDLQKLTDSIKEKLGEESSALIADDLGVLYTHNKEVQEQLYNQSQEITRLKENNAKLVSANGSLLQQIPMGKSEEVKVEDDKPTYYDYHSAFDENGNII